MSPNLCKFSVKKQEQTKITQETEEETQLSGPMAVTQVSGTQNKNAGWKEKEKGI